MAAGTVDVYITGSTAFRANVYTACQKLFVGGAAHHLLWRRGAWRRQLGFQFQHSRLGHDRHPGHRAYEHFRQHADHPRPFHRLNSGHTDDGTRHQARFRAADWHRRRELCHSIPRTAPPSAFPMRPALATPYPATGNFVEENVCVQPFVMCKSVAASGAVTTITNVTWEQLEYGIPQGTHSALGLDQARLRTPTSLSICCNAPRTPAPAAAKPPGNIIQFNAYGRHLYLRYYKQDLLHSHRSAANFAAGRLSQRRLSGRQVRASTMPI